MKMVFMTALSLSVTVFLGLLILCTRFFFQQNAFGGHNRKNELATTLHTRPLDATCLYVSVCEK